MNRLIIAAAVAGLGASLGSVSTSSAQTSGSWNVNTGGNWSTSGNWSPAVPNGGGNATLPTRTGVGSITLLVDLPVVLGQLSQTGSTGYTINAAGSNTLTLSGPRRIDVSEGTLRINAPLAGSAGLNKVGPGTLVLAGNNTFSGGLAAQGGVIRVVNGAALGGSSTSPIGAAFSGVIELDGGDLSLGGRPVTLGTTASPAGAFRVASGNVSSDGDWFLVTPGNTVSVAASSSLRITGDIVGAAGSGIAKVGAGPLTVARLGGSTPPGSSVQQSLRLTVGEGRFVLADSASPGTNASRLASLSIQPAGELDIRNNTLVIDYSGPSIVGTVRGLLASGELRSTTAGRTVGYAEASQLFTAFPATFRGQTVDSTTLLLRSTLAGDTNLDGRADFTDLLAVARNYERPGDWISGDFTFDGQVNFSDLLPLARNYEDAVNVSDGSFDPSFTSQWAYARSIVPEPNLLGVAGLMMVVASRYSRTYKHLRRNSV